MISCRADILQKMKILNKTIGHVKIYVGLGEKSLHIRLDNKVIEYDLRQAFISFLRERFPNNEPKYSSNIHSIYTYGMNFASKEETEDALNMLSQLLNAPIEQNESPGFTKKIEADITQFFSNKYLKQYLNP